MSDIVLATWETAAGEPTGVRVVPDGCRDLILSLAPGARPHWFLSDLDHQTREVRVESGVRLMGFRLHPGVLVDEGALLRALPAHEFDPVEVVARLHDATAWSNSVSDALDCLASGATSVADAATDLGVGPRTLQRLVMGATGRTPAFWLLLARARKSARAVLDAASIADAAYEHGYADQAHMTREFQRWFVVSPRRLKHDPEIAHQLLQPGYA